MDTRYVKDGKVAVILDPEFGWFTQHQDWNKVFDPAMAESIVAGTGPENLVIEWVNPGDRIRIVQHHGKEKVMLLIRGIHWITGRDLDKEIDWMVA